MDERRKFLRVGMRLKANCQVLGSEEPLTSLTRNVGGGGMSVFTKRRLPVGTVLGVEVFFPGRVAPVRFTGEVVWSGELITSGQPGEPEGFETGVRFLDITREDREFLLKYAETNPLQ